MANKKTSAAKQASAAGNRRAALHAQQQAEAKKGRRARILIAIAGVVALALVIGLVYWVIKRPPAQPPAPNQTASSSATTPATPIATAPQIAPPDGNSQDIAQAAWITVPSSNTKAGALIVDVHTDYQCPYCQLAEKAYATLLEQLSDQGDIQLRQHTRTFLDGVGGEQGNSSTKAAIAAACVDVADNTKYAAYHNLIFTNQPAEGAGFTDDQLRNTFATAAGLTGAALTTLQICYDGVATATWVANTESNNVGSVENASGSFPKYLFGSDDPLCYAKSSAGQTQQVDCSTQGATMAGVMGTPTFFVSGVRFGLGDLFDTATWAPKITSAADLLTFLKQKANS